MNTLELRQAVERELVSRLEKAVPGDSEDLPLLTRLSARMEPAMRRAFLAAVRGAVGVVDLEALAAAVQSGHMGQIEARAQVGKLSEDLQRQLLPVLGRIFALGVQVAEDALGATLTIRFDLSNPEAIAWVIDHGAELVTETTDSTRLGIREIVRVGFADGRHPTQMAREIREIIGLHSRQVAAVENFRSRLTDEGVDPDAVERRTGRYAEAQLRSRAQTIARTETISASNEGQQQLWNHARAQGHINPAETRRVWIATHDDRLDPVCERLDETEAPLDGPFRGGIMRPPAHPRCRCAMGLKIGAA